MQAGYICTFPGCHNATVGATSDGEAVVNIGVACHICAASPGGPRFDRDMSADERRSVSNGIWMCQDHATTIDSRDPKFTVELLRDWRRQAQFQSWRRVLRDEAGQAFAIGTDELVLRLKDAAFRDLEVFKRTSKWPTTSVALTLAISDVSEPVTANGLAKAVVGLDDLILVAPPGMGKTTTLFQIAEALMTGAIGTPLVVPLGDWATGQATLLRSILDRPAFDGISEAALRAAAPKANAVLLLDGWNELDITAQSRARSELTRLAAEMPELRFIISTRKLAMDVPISGTAVELMPLSEEQQLSIATSLSGDSGADLLDKAWRTAGVNELVSIPLYLSALLALPEEISFPQTKEEILRHFVAIHDRAPASLAAFRQALGGCQQDYLEGLAAQATRAQATAIEEKDAHRQISSIAGELLEEGLIAHKPQPQDALDTLVSHHVLVRAGGTPGYSFQHQQFQEWFASHVAERAMLAAQDDAAARAQLQAEMIDRRPWEEALLFAAERMARSDDARQQACAEAIIAAFDVDPMLAAEMISRSTDQVWARIDERIQALVRAWYGEAGQGRPLRFMVMTGRPEFHDIVWPLISDENHQVSLPALRAGKRFHVAQLGPDAASKIAALSSSAREVLLHELVMHGGIDGIELAAAIARKDPEPQVVAMVANALEFRQSERQLVELLQGASDGALELVAERGLISSPADQHVQERFRAATERVNAAHGERHYLRSIACREAALDDPNRLISAIGEGHFDWKNDGDRHLLASLDQAHPQQVAAGLLQRLRLGLALPYGAGDMLAGAGMILDDDELLGAAMASGAHDPRGAAAASVLGPTSAAKLLQSYVALGAKLRDAECKYDQAVGDRYHELGDLLRHVPGDSLIAAVVEQAETDDFHKIEQFAHLLARHVTDDDDRARPFSKAALPQLHDLAQRWAERMLAAGDSAGRRQMASIATLASAAPSVTLLPVLKKLLDCNLERFRAFRARAAASGWTDQQARDESSWPHTHEYQRAFMAIDTPETAELMATYLPDEYFGELAAQVLASQWYKANETESFRRPAFRNIFSNVRDRRAARAAEPEATSAEANAIFSAVDTITSADMEEGGDRLAMSLATVGAALPHGAWQPLIDGLIPVAPRRARASLLQKLILSGEIVATELIVFGIEETIEAAEAEPWILTQSNAYELREWLSLLPFSSSAAKGLAAIAALPEQLRIPRVLGELMEACAVAGGDVAEALLFGLAESDARFYADHAWRNAIMRLDSLSAASRFVDAAAHGLLPSASRDGWSISRQLAGLMTSYPEVRTQIYGMLRQDTEIPGQSILANAVAEQPDAAGLLLIVELETRTGRQFANWRTAELSVTSRVPSDAWTNAYAIVPQDAGELRKQLLALIRSPDDPAARCLAAIDGARDTFGAPESEPRHPDWASKRPWPIISID